MENKICFFSSDSRPLYKKDVFRALALPENYVIHFRYQKKYINLDLADINTLINKSCIVFFSIGNTLNPPSSTLKHVSIREAKIIAIEEKKKTGLFHFYLRLEQFAHYNILTANTDYLPNKRFVTELEVEKQNQVEWSEVIDRVKDSFPDQLLYNFTFFEQTQSKQINPIFDSNDKHSFYLFKDESNYRLDIAFYDTSTISTTKYNNIKIEQTGDLLKVNAPSLIDPGALKDDLSFNIYTKSLDSKNTFTYLTFNGNPYNLTDEKYNVEIQIQIEKNSTRSLWFAFYAVLASLSVAYGSVISKGIDVNGRFSFLLTLNILIVIAAGFLSAYKLYLLFNKK